MAFRMLVALLFAAILPAATVHAHTLETPIAVMAAEDGSFSYEMKFTVGPGSILFAGYDYQGQENTSAGLVADCFCFPSCELEEGHVVTEIVMGTLDDPTLPGSVLQTVFPCSGEGWESTTTIEPFDPAPTESTTWGRIKMLFGPAPGGS